MIAHLIDEEIFNSHYILESDTEFLKRISQQISKELAYLKKLAPSEFNQEIVDELEDQILEVYKIKTYGYLNLQDYRKKHRPKTSAVG